jgi:hypothetical protein
MLILNAGISHNSNDWLMWLTIKSEMTEKAKLIKEMLI